MLENVSDIYGLDELYAPVEGTLEQPMAEQLVVRTRLSRFSAKQMSRKLRPKAKRKRRRGRPRMHNKTRAKKQREANAARTAAVRLMKQNTPEAYYRMVASVRWDITSAEWEEHIAPVMGDGCWLKMPHKGPVRLTNVSVKKKGQQRPLFDGAKLELDNKLKELGVLF